MLVREQYDDRKKNRSGNAEIAHELVLPEYQGKQEWKPRMSWKKEIASERKPAYVTRRENTGTVRKGTDVRDTDEDRTDNYEERDAFDYERNISWIDESI